MDARTTQPLRALYEDRPAHPVSAAHPYEPRWTRGHITIRDLTHAYITIPGYHRSGLAVHRIWTTDKCLGTQWVICHAESGLRFGPFFATKREAQAKAEQLLCIEGLWEQPLEAFAHGLTPRDATRCNRILGTHYRPGETGPHITKILQERKAQHVCDGSAHD